MGWDANTSLGQKLAKGFVGFKTGEEKSSREQDIYSAPTSTIDKNIKRVQRDPKCAQECVSSIWSLLKKKEENRLSSQSEEILNKRLHALSPNIPKGENLEEDRARYKDEELDSELLHLSEKLDEINLEKIDKIFHKMLPKEDPFPFLSWNSFPRQPLDFPICGGFHSLKDTFEQAGLNLLQNTREKEFKKALEQTEANLKNSNKILREEEAQKEVLLNRFASENKETTSPLESPQAFFEKILNEID